MIPVPSASHPAASELVLPAWWLKARPVLIPVCQVLQESPWLVEFLPRQERLVTWALLDSLAWLRVPLDLPE